MQVKNNEDLIQAYGSGFLYIGKIGLFQDWRAYYTRLDFEMVLKHFQEGMEDNKIVYNACLKIEEILIKM